MAAERRRLATAAGKHPAAQATILSFELQNSILYPKLSLLLYYKTLESYA
jgi:hypothetical protein